MKIALTSQNFRTITGHAGKARRFMIFTADKTGKPVETDRLDLPKEMSMHEFRGDSHPIKSVDILITGGCGQGFMRRLAQWGIQVILTSETDPVKAVAAVLSGKELPPPLPHD